MVIVRPHSDHHSVEEAQMDLTALSADVEEIRHQGEVILMGGFNAHVGMHDEYEGRHS